VSFYRPLSNDGAFMLFIPHFIHFTTTPLPWFTFTSSIFFNDVHIQQYQHRSILIPATVPTFFCLPRPTLFNFFISRHSTFNVQAHSDLSRTPSLYQYANPRTLLGSPLALPLPSYPPGLPPSFSPQTFFFFFVRHRCLSNAKVSGVSLYIMGFRLWVLVFLVPLPPPQPVTYSGVWREVGSIRLEGDLLSS
jgi:hypothetical protein